MWSPLYHQVSHLYLKLRKPLKKTTMRSASVRGNPGRGGENITKLFIVVATVVAAADAFSFSTLPLMRQKKYFTLMGIRYKRKTKIIISKKIWSCIKIQSAWRGYSMRKENSKLDDDCDLAKLKLWLKEYIDRLEFVRVQNMNLSVKKIRNENIPSHITENIAKFAICKKYGVMPNWHTRKGDLVINKRGVPFHQLEVKAFSSRGPSSFGPPETWDRIYFVDAIDVRNKNFKVYEISLSNDSEKWKNIVISGKAFSVKEIPSVPADEKLSRLKLKELQFLCDKRGLKKRGNKAELELRLKTEKPGSKFKKPKTYGEIVSQNRRGELRSCFYDTFQPQLGEECRLIFDGHISELDNVG